MEYKTDDILLAAFLKCGGATMLRIEKEGNIGTFIFDGVDVDTVNDFFMENTKVEPLKFNNAVRALTTACKRL